MEVVFRWNGEAVNVLTSPSVQYGYRSLGGTNPARLATKIYLAGEPDRLADDDAGNVRLLGFGTMIARTRNNGTLTTKLTASGTDDGGEGQRDCRGPVAFEDTLFNQRRPCWYTVARGGML